MRDLTSAVQAELEQQKVRVVIFIEAWFATGPLRMWTGRGTTQWNGQAWSGPSAGGPATLQISPLGETGVVEATGMQAVLAGANLVLPGTSQTLLQTVQEELRQGKEATIWVGFRDSSNAILADPAIAFKGRLDAAVCQLDGNAVQVSVNFESRMIDLQRALGFGMAVDGLEIDDEAFRVAANICDEAVALKAGGTEPRYTMNGVFDTSARPGQVLEGAREAMAGWLPYVGGKWRPIAGAWRAPQVDFDESDFLGPISFQALESRRDKFNAVRGKFIDPVTWKETDYPAYVHGELGTKDGDTLWESLEQPLCVSAAECQRKAKVAVLRARGREVTMRLGRRGWRLTPGATFRASFAALGWVNKTFRCGPLGLAFEEDGEGYYVMGVNVSAIEEIPDVYAWDAATEEGALATPAAVTLPAASPSVLVASNNDPTVRPTIQPGAFASSNAGIVTGAQQLAIGTSADTSGNWMVIATVDFEVPAGATSLTIKLTGTNIGSGGICRLKISGDNLGASIHTGAAPGTPQQTRTGTGDVTFTNPVGNKLTIYGKGQTLIADDWEVKATQDVTTPLRTGKVS